jgi:hypothetical protein
VSEKLLEKGISVVSLDVKTLSFIFGSEINEM